MNCQPATADEQTMIVGRPRPIWCLWLLTAAMAGGGIALYVTSIEPLRPFETQLHIPWFVLLLGFVLAECFVLNLHFKGEAQTFSLAEIVLVIGLFYASPLSLIGAQCAAVALVIAYERRRAPLKVLYNAAQYALAVPMAVLLFRAVADTPDPLETTSWLAALAAAVTVAATTALAIAIAVSFTEGLPSRRDLVQSARLHTLGGLANAALGLVVVIVLAVAPLACILLLAPITVTFVAYRAYESERAKGKALNFLYGASQLTNGAEDLEDGLVALLSYARSTFHSELAEIIVLENEDKRGAYRSAVGPGSATFRMGATSGSVAEPLLSFASDSATILNASTMANLSIRDGLAIGPAMLAPISGDSGMRGVVFVAKGRDAGAPFEKDELNLFETFANHLAVMLEKNQLSSSLAQLQEIRRELSHQAYHDSLTGLANRVLFRDRVTEALAHTDADSGVAVLFIDLDDFKTVNDTMGHAAGDELLTIVGDRIASCVGADDTPARLGGDEFAVLLRHVAHEADARVIADRILVALGDPIEIDGQIVLAPASIGIAMHAQAMDAAELMQNADVAMYTAKRNGKGRFDMFEQTMSLSVARRHQVKIGLERALVNGEFVVHYQPVVNTLTSEVVAAEALVRWQDPVRGLLPPSEFVEIAEESGLIVSIGRYVLQAACHQAKQWSETSPGLRTFVNLSARQLAHPDLFDDVAVALQASGLDPSCLVLEVTETTMMQDIDLARETLSRLKQLGVGIAIDDFGTGYSSLSYLRQLPIDILKIAKEFIDAVDHTPEDTAFVGGIVKLGHMIGLEVVAEGVERVEQAARLVDLGCDLAQGYFYSRSTESTGLDTILGANASKTIQL